MLSFLSLSFLQCYKIISNRKSTWQEAREQCNNLQANLVSISTRQVQGSLRFYIHVFINTRVNANYCNIHM